jgi:formyltetrahydrofolate synthetase
VVALCGDIMLMPGLGKETAYTRIDVAEDGRVTGLN